VQEHHHPLGEGRGNVGAQVIGDQGQGQVDSCGDAGAGPDLAIPDVQRVRIHLDRRVLTLQLMRGNPVRGNPAPVEQPGGRGDESARANRRHTPASGAGCADEGNQVRVSSRFLATGATRQHQGVDPLAKAGQRYRPEFQAPLSADSTAVRRRQLHPVSGAPAQRRRSVPRAGEHLMRAGDVDRINAVVGNEDHG